MYRKCEHTEVIGNTIKDVEQVRALKVHGMKL